MDNKTFSTCGAVLTSALTLCSVMDPRLPREIPLFISSVSPMIQDCFTNVLSSLLSVKTYTKLECARLGVAYTTAVNGINKKIKLGANVRAGDMFKGGIMSKASELVESIMKNAIDDTDILKSICYGRLLQNIPIDNGCSDSALAELSRIVRQISYKELCVIRVFSTLDHFDSDNIDVYMRNNQDVDANIMVSNLIHLKSLGVFITIPQYKMGAMVGNIKLSSVGEFIFKMLELENIPERDLIEQLNVLKKMRAL